MKGFNWGWAVIVAFVVFTFATSSWVAYAMSTEVDLVRSDYYDNSLQHDATMSARALGIASGATITFERGARAIAIRIPQASVTGTLTLYRPDSPRRDRIISLTLAADGTMRIPTALLTAGLWHLTMDWQSNGVSYQLLQTITL